jgi:hypothetical protein
MAIEGDLKDLNLPGIVQVICLERRRFVLTVRRRGEEGAIFFEDGEIVHARVGATEGEDAVYRLLEWNDGTFRVGNHVTAPRRSITVPWSSLLLEGARRVDERADREVPELAGGRTEPALSAVEIEQDSQLEDDLVPLLSRLQHACAQLAEDTGGKRSIVTLQILTEMVNLVMASSEEQQGRVATIISLAEALDRAGDAYPRARLLQAQASSRNRLSARTVVNLYNSWSNDPEGRRETFGQVARGMIHVLDTCLSHFRDRFRSPSIEEKWREACATFLAELTRELRETQF